MVTETILREYLIKNNIHQDEILEVDSVRYSALIALKGKDSTYGNTNWFVQNHIQPNQTIIYDKRTYTSIASFFGCTAEMRPIGNMTWNKFHELEFFPPLTYSESKWNDSLFSAAELFHTFNRLPHEPFAFKADDKQYLVLVFYSLFVKKQSTNLIRETQNYIDLCLKGSCQVLYVNMDNFMYNEIGK
jgi:hypothetical protein